MMQKKGKSRFSQNDQAGGEAGIALVGGAILVLTWKEEGSGAGSAEGGLGAEGSRGDQSRRCRGHRTEGAVEGLGEGAATEEGSGAGGCEEGSNRAGSAEPLKIPVPLEECQRGTRRVGNGVRSMYTSEAEAGLAVAGKGEAEGCGA